jgi:RHS repeat-associated protein
MNKIISIFLTLLLFYFSSIPVLQTPFTPQKVYAETCIYVMDGQRNIRFVTDEIGNKVRSTEYDPFGNVTGTQGALTGNRYQFQTQQNDSESGMYYLRARYYDPATGRFISKDPVKGTLANPSSQNPYQYAYNNPINLGDPSGLYTNWNVSAGGIYGVGLTCGILFDNGKSMPYVGTGFMVPGISTSYTGAPGNATSGDSVSVGFTKNHNAAGSVNYDTNGNKISAETGVVIGAGAKTEFSLTTIHTFDNFIDLLTVPKVY